MLSSLKECTVKAQHVAINITQGGDDTYIGGFVAVQTGVVQGCRACVGAVAVNAPGSGDVLLGLGAGWAKDASLTDSSVLVDGGIAVEVAADSSLYGGGMVGYGSDLAIENCHVQVDGALDLPDAPAGIFGGFAGQVKNTQIKRSTALLLNEFAPFAYFADDSTFDQVAHYVNKSAPKYFSGLLGGHRNDPVTIANSTLLVEKDNEATPLFRMADVAADASVNNYLVTANYSTAESAVKEGLNRKAYKTAQASIEEDGNQVSVTLKDGDPIGQVNIATRSFQDAYWNSVVGSYELPAGGAEASFDYLNADEAGVDAATGKPVAGKIEVLGTDRDCIAPDGLKGSLADYCHRHAGLFVAGGPVYDLLGIKAVDPAPEPEPEPQPAPVPQLVPQPKSSVQTADGLPSAAAVLSIGLLALAVGCTARRRSVR